MKVLVNGHYGTGNIGDDYIMVSLIESIHKSGEHEITCVTKENNTEWVDKYLRENKIDLNYVRLIKNSYINKIAVNIEQ